MNNWTARLRKNTLEEFTPEDLLPDTQPAYVASWIYVFGVLTIASFLMLLITKFMGKNLRNYILRYILVLFGYDYSVVIKNRFHNNRKDRINLIDLIGLTYN